MCKRDFIMRYRLNQLVYLSVCRAPFFVIVDWNRGLPVLLPTYTLSIDMPPLRYLLDEAGIFVMHNDKSLAEGINLKPMFPGHYEKNFLRIL